MNGDTAVTEHTGVLREVCDGEEPGKGMKSLETNIISGEDWYRYSALKIVGTVIFVRIRKNGVNDAIQERASQIS